jgi:hypothetical protein
MHMRCARIVVPAVAALAAVGISRAEPEGVPAPVDAARQMERYVIRPGAEKLFGDMLGMGRTLPGGCALSEGQIDRTSVVATYTCGGRPVVLQLLHPELAPAGGVRTQRFVVTVKSGAPPDGLVDAVAERVRAGETAFEWANAGGSTQRFRWAAPVAAGAAVAILALVALRRLASRRRAEG